MFRIGSHPPNARLLAGQPATEEDTWIGTARTAEELDIIIQETTTVVDEVGGKVRVTLCIVRHSTLSTFPSSRKRRQYCLTVEQTIQEQRYYYDYHRPMWPQPRKFGARW